MFKKWFKKKNQVVDSKFNRIPTIEEIEFAMKVAQTMKDTDNKLYAFIANRAIKDVAYMDFIKVIKEIAQNDPELMKTLVGEELTNELLSNK